MTRANIEQAKFVPWFAKAGAACSIVPIARFVSPSIFALKDGGHGCLCGKPALLFIAFALRSPHDLTALLFTGASSAVAPAQGTMDFSGAQTLIGTFKTSIIGNRSGRPGRAHIWNWKANSAVCGAALRPGVGAGDSSRLTAERRGLLSPEFVYQGYIKKIIFKLT